MNPAVVEPGLVSLDVFQFPGLVPPPTWFWPARLYALMSYLVGESLTGDWRTSEQECKVVVQRDGLWEHSQPAL